MLYYGFLLFEHNSTSAEDSWELPAAASTSTGGAALVAKARASSQSNQAETAQF